MHKHRLIPTLATLLILTACQLEPKDTPDSASEATTSTEAGTDPGATTLMGVTDATGPGSESGDDPASEGTLGETNTTGTNGTDTPGTATGDTDTDDAGTDGTDTGDTDTDGAVPAECMEKDPTVSAAFDLAIPGWPDDPQDPGLSYDVVCVVDGVELAGGTLSTLLTCDVDGAPLSATLDIAAALDGAEVWGVEDSVRLKYTEFDKGEFGRTRAVELRSAADDALLVSATDSDMDEVFAARFAPLVVELVFACGDPLFDGDGHQRVDFTPVGGATLGIFAGHRGLLELSAQEGFSIDVEDAEGSDLHIEGTLKILLRRIDPGA